MINSPVAPDLLLFKQKFDAASEKNQLVLLAGLDVVNDSVAIDFLKSLLPTGEGWPTIVQGKAFQLLYETPAGKEFLANKFPEGIVPLKSTAGVDYQELQQLLIDRQWQAADKLTNLKLCELAGPVALKRQWLYFTDPKSIPVADLRVIDQLWVIHSEGQFGFSVQREIWVASKKNWDKLWPRIGWKKELAWTRYPGSFTWDLIAPRGHLPLSNQLRGVRTMAALMVHPAWDITL
jgi:GUN4-like/ARM-like repeat domain, GUN4-N terminal